MRFAVEIGEEGGKVGSPRLHGSQRIQCGIDAGCPLGVDHLARRIEKTEQPATDRLYADQAEVDANLAVAAGTACEMGAAFEHLDGDAEAHLRLLPD